MSDTGLYRDQDSGEPGGSQQSLDDMVAQREYHHAMGPVALSSGCLRNSEDSYVPKMWPECASWVVSWHWA